MAATSPYFLTRVVKQYFKSTRKTKNFLSAFDYLRNRGLIKIISKNNQIYIYLTKKGRHKAGRYQINDLRLQKPEKWDGFWRVVIFDIPTDKRMKREAFRGKIKELGFYKLQKSVWIHPFECDKEINLLRSFFGLQEDDIRVILAKGIGEDSAIRKYFNL